MIQEVPLRRRILIYINEDQMAEKYCTANFDWEGK